MAIGCFISLIIRKHVSEATHVLATFHEYGEQMKLRNRLGRQELRHARVEGLDGFPKTARSMKQLAPHVVRGPRTGEGWNSPLRGRDPTLYTATISRQLPFSPLIQRQTTGALVRIER